LDFLVNVHKAARLPLVVAVLTIGTLWISGCKDNNLVGGNLVQPNAVVQVDTIPLKNLTTTKIPAYTGDQSSFSVGMYKDQLFGTVTATGLIQPALASVGGLDTLTDDSKISLVLYINNVYGDTTASESYDVVEASSPWRGREWMYNDTPPISNTVVGSFTVGDINSLVADSLGDVDSVSVALNQSWVQKYRQAYYNATSRDSSYTYTMPGFVIVPKSEGKILAVDPSNSHLFVETPKDTARFVINDWAYSVTRTNVPADTVNHLPMYSTFESVPKFDITVGTNGSLSINGVSLGTKAIARVQMMLYTDSTKMRSTLPVNNIRPAVSSLLLYYLHSDNIQFGILNGPISGGTAFESAPGVYTLDLTSRVNSILTGSENAGSYYLLPQSHSGIIYSLLLNSSSDSLRSPKLIITSVKPTNQ